MPSYPSSFILEIHIFVIIKVWEDGERHSKDVSWTAELEVVGFGFYSSHRTQPSLNYRFTFGNYEAAVPSHYKE